MTQRIRLFAAVAIFALVGDGIIAYWNINALIAGERSLTASYARMAALETLLSTVKDAETGQRGFLLTSEEEYLAPYNDAMASLNQAQAEVRILWPADSTSALDDLDRLIAAKRAEMQETIDLQRAGRLTAAETITRRGRGRQQMDLIRARVADLHTGEEQRMAASAEASAQARRTALATAAFAGAIAMMALFACLALLRRELITRAAVAQERAVLFEREQAARTAAEEASHLKDEFLAKLSHELRNPLHAVVGWLQILRQRQDEAEPRGRAIETIERNARSLQRMIEDLLDVSRAASGKLAIQRSPTALAPLVQSVVETLRPSAAAREIALVERLDPESPMVTGDSDRLAQVVINLVSNAIKFTAPGGRVLVSLARECDDAVIAVEDNGLGISPDALQQIFEPFRQAGPRQAGPEGGLGLGLSIAKQIVELHGGSIAATSEGIGRGARFEIRLPAPAASAVLSTT